MKFLRVENPPEGPRQFVFQMTKREKDCLLDLLEFYSQLDLHVQSVSSSSKLGGEAQHLLIDAMTDLRAARGKKIECFVKNSAYFQRGSSGVSLFVISGEDKEWLLQVLNEIRVSCWINLGRPEMDAPHEFINELQVRYLRAMGLSGVFQTILLDADEEP